MYVYYMKKTTRAAQRIGIRFHQRIGKKKILIQKRVTTV